MDRLIVLTDKTIRIPIENYVMLVDYQVYNTLRVTTLNITNPCNSTTDFPIRCVAADDGWNCFCEVTQTLGRDCANLGEKFRRNKSFRKYRLMFL